MSPFASIGTTSCHRPLKDCRKLPAVVVVVVVVMIVVVVVLTKAG